MTIPELYQLFLKNPFVTTDTRKIMRGDIYFALKGPNFDGNTYAKNAIDQGASYAVVDNPTYAINDKTILVDDVLIHLQSLAKYHREQFIANQIPFIAITGSNGKTTTKELIHAVLSTKYKTYTTTGNLNNHIGVPLTILKVGADAEMAVVEMGANHQLEIASYCGYTMPTHGLITNCGKAHLEGFGGEEGIKKGKGELFDYLRDAGGTAFVMDSYDYLLQMSAGIAQRVFYGSDNAEIKGTILPSSSFLKIKIFIEEKEHTIQTKLIGDYNFPNVMAALAIGFHFSVPISSMIVAIESYEPSNSRSQLIKKGSNDYILDAYNANPSSMLAAIKNFSNFESGTQIHREKIAILGAMAELGENSLAEHEQIVAHLHEANFDYTLLVGGDFLKIKHGFLSFPNADAVKEWLKNKKFTNAAFLIKGSRSMAMERVLE